MALIRIEGSKENVAKGKGKSEIAIDMCSNESEVKKWLE